MAKPVILRRIAVMLLVFGAAWLPEAGWATQLKVSPLRLNLSAQQPMTVLRLGNMGQETVLLHLKLQQWSHPDGQDSFQKTRDILLNPMIFRMAPGEEQIVRIGLPRKIAAGQEGAYRLFIKEVDDDTKTVKDAISTKLNISLPVFIAPESAVEPRLHWRLEESSLSHYTLSVQNSGNLHAEVSDIALLRQDGQAVNSIDRRVYVLPGQARQWQIPRGTIPGDELLTVIAQSAGEPVAQPLQLNGTGPVIEALR